MELKIKKHTVVGISDFFKLIHGIQDINVWDTSNCVFHELSFMRSSKNITKLCTLVSTSKTMAGFGHFQKIVLWNC